MASKALEMVYASVSSSPVVFGGVVPGGVVGRSGIGLLFCESFLSSFLLWLVVVWKIGDLGWKFVKHEELKLMSKVPRHVDRD